MKLRGSTSLALVSLIFSAIPSFAVVKVNYSTAVYTQDTCFHGVNYVAFWDDDQGSVGSREAMRRAGVDWMRFPGGIPGDWYDWQNPLATSKTTPWSLWNYAHAAGAKVLFQTNWPGRGNTAGATTGASVAKWVDSCKKIGVDAPIWEIGNEFDNVDSVDWADTTTWIPTYNAYFAKFNEQAIAMKAANPAIKIIGPASTNYFHWGDPWGPKTVARFIRACGANADGISIHYYGGSGGADDAVTRWNETKGTAQEWPLVFNTVSRTITKPIYITEWSAMGSPGVVSTQMVVALANADLIGAFSKSKIAGHTMFGDIHLVENNWGLLANASESWAMLDEPAPNYFVIALWTKMGNVVLNCSPGTDSVNTLSAWAHKKVSNGHLTVMLINKTTAHSETVNLGYIPKTSAVSIYECKPADGTVASTIVTYNGVTNPQPKNTDLPAPLTDNITDSTYTRTLPAYSITVLDFDGPATGISFNARRSHTGSGIRIQADPITRNVSFLLDASGMKQIKSVAIYDFAGTLVDFVKPNAQEFPLIINWDAAGVRTGAYVARINTESGIYSGTVMLQ
jgi:hypothetical protein